ncbi:acyl carrier protein [Microbispora sp. H11081]|uniref:acyl carrier protein n=1 Tax=Microbispora sp. H11081 TaxID=2729107 RepID=UPI001474A559|nr:acyl carrier protein [Microbispora sp. H11081]
MSAAPGLWTHDALRHWLVERVSGYLGLPAAEIDPAVKLRAYGLDSVHALSLCVDVEEAVGLLVEPTLAWDHPTIDAIAAHLAGLLAEDETPREPRHIAPEPRLEEDKGLL